MEEHERPLPIKDQGACTDQGHQQQARAAGRTARFDGYVARRG
jgi:hypothetical protein